ncbi:hypothetical protein [Hyphomonas johnsonii]|uniref:Uncharacterized protein n=1 Tax=Hyphomonas johnsonii MHS-2 TaxID=1280950 RepID=A0A059FJY3_9PROT|nr:hypothetical protein [Hyphomonas johnsonii]KCZ90798.1 hypothetical protein HJO_13141 [Hyphomonas johnsonii MHS-2]
MNPRHAHLYAHVHVLFWPWLWLQLWNLNRWMKATGRRLLVSVDRRGNIYIRCMSDAPGQGAQAFRAPVSARLALAVCPAPCPWRRPGPPASLSGLSARPAGLCQDRAHMCALPLPDT